MTMRWVLATVLCGALLAVAALAAERTAGWFRLPRRWVWAPAMAGSLGIPAVALALPGVLPHLRLPARDEWTATDPPLSATAVDAGASPRFPSAETGPLPAAEPLPRGAYLAWAAASLAIIAALAASRRRLVAACGATTAQRVAGTRVLVSEHAGPMVLGVLAPVIVLPRWALGEPADELRLIVRHEREHVDAGDPWLLAVASLAVALMPWSPALWYVHRRLRLAVEIDCDARVLNGGESRRGYVNALLDTAARPGLAAWLGWRASRSQLERRLLAITAPRPRWRLMRALPLVACAAALAACRVATDGAVRAPERDAALVPIDRMVPAPHQTGFAASDTTVEVSERGGRLQMSFAVVGRDGRRWMWNVTEPDNEGQPLGFEYRYPDAAGSAGLYPAREFPVITAVHPRSPASRVGLRAGDRLLAVNGGDARQPFLSYKRARDAYTVRVAPVHGGDPETIVFPPTLTRAEAERRLRTEVVCLRKMASTLVRVRFEECRSLAPGGEGPMLAATY
ncbi:MAG TPA: M56 family metallopeptidase [Longimicrobium sp.]|nr:M56 family metallopeptidase [Longimicrobium sp.]